MPARKLVKKAHMGGKEKREDGCRPPTQKGKRALSAKKRGTMGIAATSSKGVGVRSNKGRCKLPGVLTVRYGGTHLRVLRDTPYEKIPLGPL